MVGLQWAEEVLAMRDATDVNCLLHCWAVLHAQRTRLRNVWRLLIGFLLALAVATTGAQSDSASLSAVQALA